MSRKRLEMKEWFLFNRVLRNEGTPEENNAVYKLLQEAEKNGEYIDNITRGYVLGMTTYKPNGGMSYQIKEILSDFPETIVIG